MLNTKHSQLFYCNNNGNFTIAFLSEDNDFKISSTLCVAYLPFQLLLE